MARKIVLVVMIGLLAVNLYGHDDRVWASLQASLDSALPDDRPIVLIAGTDFTAPAGTVIFLSRKRGMERMVRLAREGEPELAMLFLPKREAWITETEVRASDEARLDSRYAVAAIASGAEVELWHTHNDVGEKLLSSEAIRMRSLQWTMPSSEDMVQLYGFEAGVDNSKVSGVIANIYGVTVYRTSSSLWSEVEPSRVGYTLQGEAYRLNYGAGEIQLAGLREFARKHQGYIELRFEPVR